MGPLAGAIAGMGKYLAPAALGISAASQVLGGISAYGDSRAQASAAETNTELAAEQAGNQASQERDKYRRFASSQKATLGASGVDVNVGSPIDVLADTDAEGEVSAMQLLYGGQLEAANWRQRAQSLKSQGRGSLIGGILGGVGTGLLGASQLGYFRDAPGKVGSSGTNTGKAGG